MPTDFRVDLDVFRGPLDLLLYLVRKHELEITDIPIALVTEQYLAYLEVLRQLDLASVGDFVEMASTLIEIKSRLVLPHGGEEEPPLEDPRQNLVERLLEYKKFRDAASMLDERGRQWQERFARLPGEPDEAPRDPAAEPIAEVELWDLVSAFGRIVREHQVLPASNIVYDDTPIRVYMARIYGQLIERGRVRLSDLFQSVMHKSRMVGIFLAVLELVRHHRVQAEQSEPFAEIWLAASPDAAAEVDFSAASNYDHGPRPADREP